MPNAPCPTCGGSVDAQTGVCPQCTTQVASRSSTATVKTGGEAPPAQASENPEISGYRILGRLGEGGMGAVYLAEETTLGRRVAVKVISSRIAPDAQSKARFLREARTLATIEHPHVVRVYSFGEVEGRPYLGMEYVEGETLTDRIARVGKLPLDDALRITRDVVDALDAAWERRVIHRDIKPSNILIDRRGRVRVADFGLAKPKDSDDGDAALTQSGLMVGTPHYISPEQAQGRELDFRSDFYSLGIMLYHMLAGERPFQGSTPVAIVAKHLHEPMPLLRSRRADLPEEIERLIVWMTAKDAAQRPGSHRELLAALDALITRTPTAPMPTFSTVAIPRPRVNARAVAYVLVAIMVACAAFEFFVWRRRASNDRRPDVSTAAPRPGFIVAVAPFYGPDEDSAKEGRVMAALIERAVGERLRGENARVAGIEDTKTAVRSHDEARELGKKLGASAVIWGEAFALRTETEIRPYVTVVAQARKEAAADASKSGGDERLLSATRPQSADALSDTGAAPVRLEAQAPNQIELRKTSASGIGDLVVLLAGIHALDNESNYDKALALFRQAPRTAETLRYEVQALLRGNKRDEAQGVLEESLKMDPGDAPSLALLGDLHLAQSRVAEAIDAYRRAAETGRPFTSTRGILHGGKLYSKETYRHRFLNGNHETETLYLLGTDPGSLRVVERYSLPGLITGFRTEGDALLIACQAGKDASSLPLELRFRRGRFDRPLWPPPNLLWRMRSMRAGRVIPGNFLREIDTIREFGAPGGRFVLGKEPSSDLPATLPDLERALRAAADHDPTQPWHLFFLALTLRAQGRMTDANEVLEEIIRRPWPGVPYFEFTWMLSNLERLQYADWADRLYPKAAAKRRELPQPVYVSTLIERLINQPYIRQVASNRDVRRGYAALLHAREIGGLTPDGEDLVAGIWAREFDRTGQTALAAHERAVVREVNAHPLNYLAANAKVDYATAFLVATGLTSVVLFASVAVLAAVRARRLPAEPQTAAWRARLARIPAAWRATLIALVVGASAFLVLWVFLVETSAQPAVLIAIALILTFRLLRVSPARMFVSVTKRERFTLLAAYLLFLVALSFFVWELVRLEVVMSTPVGLADGFGHPQVIQELEKMSGNAEPSEAMSYVLAVASHYGGDIAQAEARYNRVSMGYARTRDNLAALKRGALPVALPTPSELARAMLGSPGAVLKETIADRDVPHLPLILLFGMPLVLLGMFFVRPRDPGPLQGTTLPAKVAMLLVPGAYDLRQGKVVRAIATLLLITVAILPVAAYLTSDVAAFGWATAIGAPNLNASFPMPGSSPNPMQDARLGFVLGYPYASLFIGFILAAVVAGLTLHVLRIPAILREPRRARDQVVRSNLASVST